MAKAKTPAGAHIPLMGLNIQGDVGPFTCYKTRKKRVIWFVKAPPKKPPTLHQQLNHDRWRAAAELWRELTVTTKNTWRSLAIAGNLRISGYNLFLYWFVTNDRSIAQTLIRNTGIDPFNPQ